MIDNDNVMKDLLQDLHKADSTEIGFLCQQISKQMEKNRYKLFFDRQGDLTSLGEIVAQIHELLFVHGVLKLKGGETGEGVS